MPDLLGPVIVDALTRAVASPGGVPLYGSKTANGLFSATSSCRKAAQHCKDEGWLRVVRSEARGKSIHEVCALTEKGLAHLLAQVDAKPVLHELVRALDASKTQVAELVETALQGQLTLESLRKTAEQALRKLEQPPVTGHAPMTNGNGAAKYHDTPDASAAILAALTRWQALEDCPLVELYRQVHNEIATLTIGQFHDALRRLHEQQRIYLHPWTGPLYDLPEPAYALLAGHEVAYYASKR